MQQDLFVSRDQRQLGDALARGKLTVALGVSFYTLEGFLTANLPVKELPKIKEGLPSSNRFGVIGVVGRIRPIPCGKVFVNWLLSKEGQELYVKVMHQSTRRWTWTPGGCRNTVCVAAKDVLTVQQYHKVRNHLEDKYKGVRIPSAKFAEEILQ